VTDRKVELSWDMRALIADIGGRSIRIGGESFGDSPDVTYGIYARWITAWDDGTTLSDEEQAQLLDEVADEAARRGWKVEVDRS
jgi:hypothetical protein